MAPHCSACGSPAISVKFKQNSNNANHDTVCRQFYHSNSIDGTESNVTELPTPLLSSECNMMKSPKNIHYKLNWMNGYKFLCHFIYNNVCILNSLTKQQVLLVKRLSATFTLDFVMLPVLTWRCIFQTSCLGIERKYTERMLFNSCCLVVWQLNDIQWQKSKAYQETKYILVQHWYILWAPTYNIHWFQSELVTWFPKILLYIPANTYHKLHTLLASFAMLWCLR